jgi:hypothetical protein
MCVLRNPKNLHIHKINHPPPREHLHQLKVEDQAQDDDDEDQEEPPQEEDNDQRGDANDQDKEDDKNPRPPHPVNTILGDIHKGGNHSISCCSFL